MDKHGTTTIVSESGDLGRGFISFPEWNQTVLEFRWSELCKDHLLQGVK